MTIVVTRVMAGDQEKALKSYKDLGVAPKMPTCGNLIQSARQW